MDEAKMTDLLFEINGKLAAIETKLDSLSESILKHEARLTAVEDKLNAHLIEVSKREHDGSFKTELLKLLAKALLIAVTSIGALAGASSLI